jgi:hypothetical protein
VRDVCPGVSRPTEGSSLAWRLTPACTLLHTPAFFPLALCPLPPPPGSVTNATSHTYSLKQRHLHTQSYSACTHSHGHPHVLGIFTLEPLGVVFSYTSKHPCTWTLSQSHIWEFPHTPVSMSHMSILTETRAHWGSAHLGVLTHTGDP